MSTEHDQSKNHSTLVESWKVLHAARLSNKVWYTENCSTYSAFLLWCSKMPLGVLENNYKLQSCLT